MEHFSKVLAIVRAFKVQVLNRVRWLWEDLPDGYDSFWLLDIYLAVAGKSLKSLVEPLFFFIYYASLIIVGTVFVVILREPFSFITLVVLSSTTISALECYCLCYLLDSFKDINETITDHAFCLCSQLPHSGDHHADYVDVRATLMVVGYFCRHGMSFQCAGIGDISSVVFADLVNISYSVLTFLLNVL
ncbi:hypothetical protein pipiens_006675 [Culex pipiens pipiens]|uniref:Odorant receptor n=1 Tax=Culex pipiens pipiens TaxID=38569 RepID=A0ABD1DNL8_CULPP